jgi:hypothetical protein
MTTPSTAPAEMKPAKSNRMTLYIAVAVIVIIIVGAAVYVFSQTPTFTPTRTIYLNGSSTKGWNNTLNTLSFSVNKSDNVRVVLLSTDGSLHDFVIAFSNNAPSSPPSAGDLVSKDFSSTSVPYNFDIPSSQLQLGTFKFYCQYHFNTGMVGSITIKNA